MLVFHAISQERLMAWLESLRLKTLPLALSGIILGSALAYWHHHFSWLIMFFSLFTATLLQILSNLANDYGDMKKGSDDPNRIGPLRGMQKGLISPSQMKKALILTAVLSIISGLCLLFLSCHTLSDFIGFLFLGLLSIIAAITYTVGIKPYGYRGLGDISVLLFFGLLAVIGVYYLQTKSFQFFLLLPALGSGLLSVAVLNVNNLRDIENDQKAGKNTIVVRLGPIKGRYYHVTLLLLAFLLISLFVAIKLSGLFAWSFIIVLPLVVKHIHYVITHLNATAMRPMLVEMVKIAILTNLLLSIGIISS